MTRASQSAESSEPAPTAALLDARSVAVIGASPDDDRIGGKPMRFLIDFGFRGRIYPVNPRYPEIRGHRCYPDLEAIGDDIDIAVVAVPFQQAQAVIEQCVRKRVRQVVMFSSGYAETGPDGAQRQRALERAIAGSGVRLLGPNTLGFANLSSGLIANFGQAFELPRGLLKPGRAGFVSQSGAFGTFIFALSAEQGIGYKYFAVTGNEADLTVSELIDAMAADPEVDLVAGYVEGIRDGRRFLEACERARAAAKPIVLIKTGRTAGGSAAAMSHTAAIAGADEVYDAVFRQTGAIRVVDEEEMLDVVTLMRAHKRIAGRRVGVVTMSGGAGVMLADAIEHHGLQLARLQPQTEARLAQIVPAFGSVRNPVDLTGQFLTDPGLLTGALSCLLDDPGVDAVVFFLGLGRRYGERIAQTLRDAAAATDKPIVVAWTAGPAAIIADLRSGGLPVLPTPTRSIRALAALARFAEAGARPPRSFALPPASAESLRTPASDASAGRCSEATTKAALARYGLRLMPETLVRDEDEAVAAAAALGYPVALKVCAADLPHKTEAGAIALGVGSEAELRRAHRRIVAGALEHVPGLATEGVLVAPMAEDGVEVIVGARRDPVFGPVLMVGSGGIYTEILRDAAIGVLPLAPGEPLELIRSLRVYPLLQGARGRAAADVDALVDCIETVARLMLAHPEVAEIEINPLRVLAAGRGAVPLDALMRIQSASASEDIE
ncbi:MAG TPA: acetate--CoA ligase family protein [Burkholderiaceae bacterium]|nr:acetate--CoA ligase family protein [Burkholderiaceae bacterium]